MKTDAIVPMKLNNRHLPQKNAKPFTSVKPLCYYNFPTLLKIDEIDEVYVYCSNPDIQVFIPEGVKYLRRSESLDQDTTSMAEVLTCVTKEVPVDIYVMTHSTAPFVTKESIEKGLGAVIFGRYDSAFTAKKFQVFIQYCKKEGIQLVNCSSSTVLDSIPRAKFEDVIRRDN